MALNPYKIFNLDENAPFSEIEVKYTELKAKFSEDRFLPGEEGNDAARNLEELEQSFKELKRSNEAKKFSETHGGGDYARIDALIRAGNYSEAQALLDSHPGRDAEWHYLQSIIFYRREWMNESRVQLQMALNMEPWNEKYKTAYTRLEQIMGNMRTDPRTVGQPPPNPNPQEGQMCGGNACINCCLAYCIADCCCSCLQCC
ncbi:MAG: hypothetical protein FWE22_07280 [Firmicutes bacterium]|nr:hypothetical protein [Bacillota bacterium]